MHTQRGTTLIEMLLVVAILAMISGVAFLAASSRLFETQSAATVFDSLLAHAKTLASTNGGTATLAFSPAAIGDGTVVALSPPDVPPETLRASVSEPVLGKPPFTITVDAYGHAVAPQPCPAAGGYLLAFTAGPASESRLVPCVLDVAGSPEPRQTMPP